MVEQRLAVQRPAARVADAVDVEHRVADAVAREQQRGDLDHLDVGLGARDAEALDAELVGLAVAPRLRALVAKERPDVVQPLRPLREQLVLEQRAHDARRQLGPQRHAAVALVDERVHLFFDDVGRLADAAREQLGRLEDRRADLAVAEPVRDLAAVGFEPAPTRRFGRKDVLRAARGADADSRSTRRLRPLRRRAFRPRASGNGSLACAGSGPFAQRHCPLFCGDGFQLHHRPDGAAARRVVLRFRGRDVERQDAPASARRRPAAGERLGRVRCNGRHAHAAGRPRQRRRRHDVHRRRHQTRGRKPVLQPAHQRVAHLSGPAKATDGGRNRWSAASRSRTGC